MTRYVKCYAINNTDNQIQVAGSYTSHGKCSLNPQTINANQSETEIFQYQKQTGALYGTAGYVQYTLPDNSVLSLYFCCPYTEDGASGNGGFSNCWFYAAITPPSGKTSQYMVSCAVNVDGTPSMQMNTIYPVNGNTVSAVITIMQA